MVRNSKKCDVNSVEPYVKDLAVSSFGDEKDYGSLMRDIYSKTIGKAPNQKTWDMLYVDELASEDGSIDKSKLQAIALKVMNKAVVSSKLLAVLKDVGVETDALRKYQGKAVSELPAAERDQIIAGYMNSMADQYAIRVLEAKRREFASGLENIFCKEESPPRSGKANKSPAKKKNKAKKKKRTR